MAEEPIKRAVFRTALSGLYKFICMPFGLASAGFSFSRLMEQSLGDQQFVTLLLWLDDICGFAPDSSTIIDEIELVFSRLKEFHLKIKPKFTFVRPA